MRAAMRRQPTERIPCMPQLTNDSAIRIYASEDGRDWLGGLRRCIEDPAVIDEMMKLNYQFFKAPVVVYLCMNRNLTPWSIFDLGLLAQSIMLAAQEHGVGSAPAVTLVAHPELIRAELKIPDDLSIIIGIALGYADGAHPQNKYRSPRRTIHEAATFRGV